MTKMLRTAQKKLVERSNVVKLRPRARLPRASVLATFEPEDAGLLRQCLADVAEYVRHSDFRRLLRTAPHVQDGAAYMAKAREFEADAALGRAPVLTAAAERELFVWFNYCRFRVLRILKQFAGEQLTARAARDLIAWARVADAARSEIATANTALAMAMARRTRSNNVEVSDLVAEGNLALLRCVDKFDCSRGFKFSTYACRAILASFSRMSSKAVRYRTQFPAAYDPKMERSDYLERRREQIETEFVEDLREILDDNAAELSNVEQRVLKFRFALGAEADDARKGKTLEQVGELLGVSKERVRQIQNQALGKLRALLDGQVPQARAS